MFGAYCRNKIVPSALISAGKTEVPPVYAEAVRTSATWNEQLDEILVRMVDDRGGRWKVRSGLLGDFTENECKNWWMFLTNLKRLRSGGIMFAPNSKGMSSFETRS
jgi:hypothetical protein